MPAYRVWDIRDCVVRQISYNFISHEGFYPFREKKNWPPSSLHGPEKFSPITDGVLSVSEWKRYAFDKDESGHPAALKQRSLPDSRTAKFSPCIIVIVVLPCHNTRAW